ncbi:protein kinase [bacterium]|nr:protein kinase [bacterium]
MPEKEDEGNAKVRNSEQMTLCDLCNKPVANKLSSITQWIFRDDRCTCEEICRAPKPEEVALIERKKCNSCGRELRPQKSGSITQWIFSTYYCSCSEPALDFSLGDLSESSNVRLYERTKKSDFDHIGVDSVAGWIDELDRYTPLKKLGEGGAGEVFLCNDTLLNKLVAVKFLRVITAKSVIAFQNEARIASKLDHPGIVRILDFGLTDSSTPYMVMEPLPGRSLKSFIEINGPLRESKAIEIGIKLCSSLLYAHRAGTFHRDIKPTNIIILEDAKDLEPVLIDFGIAKINQEADSDKETQSTTIAGTPEYMSPDAIARSEYSVGSEIYSFGCIFYEMLSGHPPFEAESALEVLSMHVQTPVPKLDEVTPKTWSIIEKCLSKNAEQRHEDMNELRKELLEALVEEQAFQSQFLSKDEPVKPISKRLGWLSLFSVVLCMVGIFSFLFARDLLKGRVDKGEQLKKEPLENFKQRINEWAVTNLDSYTDTGVSWIVFNTVVCDFFTDRDLKEAIVHYPKYTSWMLSKADITSSGISRLRSLNVRSIALKDCININEKFLSELRNFEKLETLELTDCDTKSDYLVELIGTKQLRSITLGGGSFDGSCCKFLSRIQTLNAVSLSGIELTAKELSFLTQLPELVVLNLDFTTYSKPPSSENLTSKNKRQNYKPDQKFLTVLESLKQLERLSIAGMDLSGRQRGALRAKLPNCRVSFPEPRQSRRRPGRKLEALSRV